MIKHAKGDLFKFFEDGACDTVAHCCNCKGVMGSGIALTIKDKYPGAYKSYKDHEYRNAVLKLGTTSSAFVGENKLIVNLHAQSSYGYNAFRYVNYEALYESLIATRNEMIASNHKILGVPYKMACDRAGGDWRIVEAMLDAIFSDANLEVLVVEYSKEL
jgi:hypothetical protein